MKGKKLLRRTKSGDMMSWLVETDGAFCTLDDAFRLVKPGVGFNIELKLDNYKKEDLKAGPLKDILAVTSLYGDREIIFSSFNPDAAQFMKELNSTFRVFFLTEGGNMRYNDIRMNSIDEAIDLCKKGGLDGMVADGRALFRYPEKVKVIKDLKLTLMSYGKINDNAGAVHVQRLMGLDGVIVDLVEDTMDVVSKIEVGNTVDGSLPRFSMQFLLALTPELMQQE